MAGVSADYYIRLEKGNLTGVSDSVLHAVARALHLNEAERAHLFDLVGELSTRSEAFRTRWAAHDVRLHRTGVKHFQHPAVGRLDLTFDAMEIPTDPGLTMTCYTAEPGTASEENLKLLASWGATLGQGDLKCMIRPPDAHPLASSGEQQAAAGVGYAEGGAAAVRSCRRRSCRCRLRSHRLRNCRRRSHRLRSRRRRNYRRRQSRHRRSRRRSSRHRRSRSRSR